ncbi:MAG: tetratricopeptide repeat protein [Candidatus Thermoplasmatota archaeon]|nr:tetratricopeptide repeat protein [Candidatus Thermoplasmatota archaeon]
MSEGNSTNPIDAAAEITDAMMSSLADVVKTVISKPDEEKMSEETTTDDSDAMLDDGAKDDEPVIDTTVDDIVAEGEAAHRSGDHDSALKSFNKAIALDPSNPMAWFNRGVLLEAEQDPKGAKQAFVICLDLDPNHGPALANLAVLLDRLGDADGALEIADRALNYFPGHPHLVRIVETNRAAGGVIRSTPTVMPHTQEKLVEQTLTHAVDSGIDDLFEEETHFDSNDVAHSEDDESEHIPEIAAEEVPEVEIEESPKIDLDMLCDEATNILTSGDAKGALQILKEHLHGEAAQHFDSWRISAGAMAAMGLDDHAIAAYNHAIGLNQDHAKCYFNLGALHERKGNIDAAKKCFINAVEKDSSYSKAALRLANLSESTGDIPNLLIARRQLISEDGGKEALAVLLVELAEGEAKILENTGGLPPTIPEGPALATEAVELCEPNTPIHARALSASNQHTEAVKTWKAMIQSDKLNPELWTGLARSLESAGDMQTAQRCHEKASVLSNPQPVDPLDALMDSEESQASLNAVETSSEQSTVQQPIPTPTPPPIQLSTEGDNLVQQPVPTPTPPSMEPSSQGMISQPVPTPTPPQMTVEPANVPLPNLTARPEPEPKPVESKPQVDLAAAALDAAARVAVNTGIDSNSNSIANQDIEWYNKGVGLIEDKKYREALSCFDRALPSFADDDEMVIRILNGRGNALYYLEDYPKCVESYHKAMVINPKGVQGKTLYNMGTAYAEMQRFSDAIKCFEQAMPRGLDKDQQKLAKEQIRRCNILQKEQQRKMG